MTPPTGRVERTRLGDRVAEHLAVADAELTLLPDLGLLGASWRVAGDEWLHADVDAYAAGHTTGLPLLYPWANRLSGTTYRACGRAVAFAPDPPVHLAAGLPIHGTMTARPGWVVSDRQASGSHAATVARFAFDSPDLLASFPFPHTVEVRHELSARSLAVTVTVHADAGVDVPVSFGWHPYLRVPGVARQDVAVGLPDRVRLALDDRMIPTGTGVDEPAAAVPLGAEGDPGAFAFDDGYRLTGSRELSLQVDGRRVLTARLERGYDHAQVYAPREHSFVCLEPMTAPTDALVTGAHPTVAAGERYVARFVLVVE